jgi:hypothetical protein
MANSLCIRLSILTLNCPLYSFLAGAKWNDYPFDVLLAATDRQARQIIARELGHSRVSIVKIYCS